MSAPIAAPAISPMRKASAPYFSITSSGSTPLLSDLLNLRPSLARTSPCISTFLNGACPRWKPLISIIRETHRYKISYAGDIKAVGWEVARSSVFSGQPRVEKVHSAEENHVSSTSDSCSHSAPSGTSRPQYTWSPLYHTGIRCPNQICRLMHQSRKLSIQWKYALRNPSCGMSTDPPSTDFFINSLSVIRLPPSIPWISEWAIVKGLSTSTHHCNFGNGSTIAPVRSEVETFCLIVSSLSKRLFSRNHVATPSRASSTFLSANSPASGVILAYSLITCTTGRFFFCAMSQSWWLCAGVTPKAPVPKVGATESSATTFIVSMVPAKGMVKVCPM